jgi:hypothetical protein
MTESLVMRKLFAYTCYSFRFSKENSTSESAYMQEPYCIYCLFQLFDLLK